MFSLAIDKDNALLDVTGEYINRKFQEQSWFKENANTITTAAGFVATVVAWLASQPFAADPKIQFAILILGFLATVFGVKKTPNGISKSQIRQFSQAQAKFIDETPLVIEPEPEVSTVRLAESAEELSTLVREYNRLQE